MKHIHFYADWKHNPVLNLHNLDTSHLSVKSS